MPCYVSSGGRDQDVWIYIFVLFTTAIRLNPTADSSQSRNIPFHIRNVLVLYSQVLENEKILLLWALLEEWGRSLVKDPLILEVSQSIEAAGEGLSKRTGSGIR